jgi:Icc-related predicted phosphoesterase
VGSTGVRSFIEEREPLLSLHGHVHESAGIATIGRTTCINPGSEYTDGVLNGAVVEVGDGEIITSQLVTG